MKQNKTLFNQIFEKFQTLNEADEQLLQDKFKDDENKKEIIDKIIKKALGEGDGDEKEAKELIDRIKKSLGK